MNSRCPFCRPAPDRVFHESPLVIGLWDAFPVAPGHALLITRRHIPTWFEATAAEQAAMLEAIPIARTAIGKVHRADGFNIGINIGEAAGQTVMHVHVHVIPRVVGDVDDPRGGVRFVIPSRGNYTRPGHIPGVRE